jgi:exopolyphosphatase/guanosine-5'-triphosphate,3'-diphosphate pyrophosphatase
LLNIEKYGAVDIGSNAIRLLIATVIEQEGKDTIFKKTSLIRVPVRLGEDVFLKGKISETNYLRMVDSINAFRLLMKTHKVVHFRACATSAMREASNGAEIVERLRRETGTHVSIIDGKDEAAIIASTDLKSLIDSEKTFLYVDVGGGSTEFTLFANSHTISSRSFNMGTVRMISEMVEEGIWQEMETWVKAVTKPYSQVSLIGSGGNINHIYKNSGKKIGKPLSYFYLGSYYDLVKSYSYEERITEMNMNQDRADVILPAIRIYLSAMKWSGSKNMYVPKIGLSDGIVKSLYNEKKAMELEVR